MKTFLIGAIRLYWAIVPKHKRRPCIFEETCSKYVYRITKDNGLIDGLTALKERFHQCRPGYKIYKDQHSGKFELCLKDGTIVSNDKISRALLPPFNYNYVVKD